MISVTHQKVVSIFTRIKNWPRKGNKEGDFYPFLLQIKGFQRGAILSKVGWFGFEPRQPDFEFQCNGVSVPVEVKLIRQAQRCNKAYEIRNGLLQCAEYAVVKGCTEAILLIFDMRNNARQFIGAKEIKLLNDIKKVGAKIWFVHCTLEGTKWSVVVCP